MGNDLERIATEHSVEYLLDVEAELGRRDLFYFTTEILRVQDDSPFVRPRSEIEPICIWLAKPKPDWVSGQSRWKRFLALPRGTAKTTLVSAYVAWRIVRNPNIAVYYTSEEKALALDISETISQMLTSERVEAIYGKFQGERNWQKGKYVIAQRTARRKDPTLMAGGVDVSAQGRHPDLIIADDLQGKTNVKPDGIEKVKEYLRLIWPVLNPGGELVYICTRWDYADCAADILKQRSIDPTSWDAPGSRGYFGATAQVGDEEFFPHAVPGKPLFPSILDEATQSELKLSMNIYHYTASMRTSRFRPRRSISGRRTSSMLRRMIRWILCSKVSLSILEWILRVVWIRRRGATTLLLWLLGLKALALTVSILLWMWLGAS